MNKNFDVVIGVSAISDQISPYNIFSSDYEIARALFAPLFKAKKDFSEVLPNIVDKWKFNSSNNEYTFEMRKDIYFHNGRNAIAKDLEFSIVRGMLQGARRMFSQLLSCIYGYEDVCTKSNYFFGMCKGIKVSSKYKLKIKLKKNIPLFIKYFTRSCMSIVPIEELEEDNLWIWKNKPVGVGAYKVDFIDPYKNYFILRKFNKYFENHKNAPNKLIFTKYKSIDELDICSEIEFSNSKQLIPLKTPIPMTIAIEYFTLNDNDMIWRDLRTLVNLVIDKENLVSCLSEDRIQLYKISNNFVPKSILPIVYNKYNYDDIFEAKKKFIDKWGEIPRVNVLIYKNYSEKSDLRKLQLKLYNTLYEKGFDVKKVSLTTLTQKLNSNELNLLVSSSSFNYLNPDDISLFFGDNKEIYRADTKELKLIRKLIKKAKQTENEKEILKIYIKVVELVNETQIIFPIATTNEYYFIRENKICPDSFLNNFFQPAYEYLKENL